MNKIFLLSSKDSSLDDSSDEEQFETDDGVDVKFNGLFLLCWQIFQDYKTRISRLREFLQSFYLEMKKKKTLLSN